MSNTYDSDATEFLESQSQEINAKCKAAKPNRSAYGKEEGAASTPGQASVFHPNILPDAKKGEY